MNKLEKICEVRANDFDMNEQFRVCSILDYFQDIAGKHATLLNVGYDKMIEKNYYWILMKTKFEIINNPKSESEIKLVTWPSDEGKLDFIRDYEIRDINNNLLIKGASQWVVIDSNSRRIVRSADINLPYLKLEENYIKTKFEKINILKLEEYDFKYQYKTVNYDLDRNLHVNNTSYARVIFDGLDFKYAKNILEFEINYIKESTLNEDLDIYYKVENNVKLGLIVGNNINRVSFKIKYK